MSTEPTFTYPERHAWRRRNYDEAKHAVATELRHLADEIDAERVRYDNPAFVPAKALADDHFGDEVWVAAQVVNLFVQGINHAGRSLDRLVRAGHECALLRWEPDRTALGDARRDLDTLRRAVRAVLDTPTGKVARADLRKVMERLDCDEVPA